MNIVGPGAPGDFRLDEDGRKTAQACRNCGTLLIGDLADLRNGQPSRVLTSSTTGNSPFACAVPIACAKDPPCDALSCCCFLQASC